MGLSASAAGWEGEKLLLVLSLVVPFWHCETRGDKDMARTKKNAGLIEAQREFVSASHRGKKRCNYMPRSVRLSYCCRATKSVPSMVSEPTGTHIRRVIDGVWMWRRVVTP